MLFHRNGNLQNSSSRMWSSYKIGLDVLNQRLNKLEDGSFKNEEINKLLSDPEDGVRSWKNLFKAKRLLVQHMEPEQIQAEIVSSLAQARLCGVPEVEDLAVELENSKEDPKAQRAYYDQLLDSLHYRHYQRMLQDETRTNTAFALNWFGVIVVLVTALAFLVLTLANKLDIFAHHSFLLVMWFGMLGAYLSRMIAFQGAFRQLDHSSLRIDFSLMSLGVRLIVGALAALIFYLLILGDLVGGEFFPELAEEPFLVDRDIFREPRGPDGADQVLLDDEGAGQPKIEGASGSEDQLLSEQAGDAIAEASSPTLPEPAPDTSGDAGTTERNTKINLFSSAFAKLLIWATLAGFSERLLSDRLQGIWRGNRRGDNGSTSEMS